MKENLTLLDLPPIGESEKLWWKDHNLEYYHYFYRIDNILNNKFYYGIHSILKTNPKSIDLSKDGYWGSGVGITRAIKKYGVDKFTKTVLKVFNTRDEARLEEMIIVDEDMIKDPMCYNSVLGGGSLFITEGLVVVRLADQALHDGKSFLISMEEYHANKYKYITPTTGKVCVNYRNDDMKLETPFLISAEEYYKNKDVYISASRVEGKTYYKDKDNWSDVRLLSTEDPLVLSGKFIGINKGVKQSKETIAKRIGDKNGSYGSFWITNGKESKKIRDEEIPDGWRRGRTITKGDQNH